MYLIQNLILLKMKTESNSACRGDFLGDSLSSWEECERSQVSGPVQLHFGVLLQRRKVWTSYLHLGSVV